MQICRSSRLVSIVISFTVFAVSQTAFAQARSQPVERPVEKPPTQLKVFNLQYANAHMAAELLTQVMDSNTPFRAAIDERTNSLLISGSRDSLSVVENLLSVIDRDAPDGSSRTEAQDEKSYRIHIDWLLTGDVGQPIPARLNEVTMALKNHGIDGLQLAAATITSVQADINPQFQLSCSPLENDVNLEISGSLIPKAGSNPGLQIEVTAEQKREGSRSSAKQLGHLSTSVSARIGHPVVLAVAPINGVSSVFVVTVEDASKSHAKSATATGTK